MKRERKQLTPCRKELSACVQQRAGYHAGFYDAQNLEPIFDDAPADYRAGWEGYWTARELLREGM